MPAPKRRTTRKPAKETPTVAPAVLSGFREAAGSALALRTKADLGRLSTALVPVLNASPVLGEMFLADPASFLDDLGVKLGAEMKRHLDEAAPPRSRDKARYEALRSGRARPGGIVGGLRFHVKPEVARLAPPRKAAKGGRAQGGATEEAFLDALRVLGASQLAGASGRKGGGITAGSPGTLTQALSTHGWRIVLQLGEPFHRDAVGLFVTLQFSLAAIADIFGDVPEGILTPDHSFEGWFLVPFRVKLRIPSPQYRQEGAAPDEAGLSFAFTADVSVRRSDGTWTAPARFEGDALVDAPIERVAGTRSYRMGFADTQLQLAYATPPDAMADAFVQFAIHDYLRRRWRAFPLTPTLADERPFQIFDESQCFTLDGAGGDNALTIVWGDGTAPFPEFLLRPGNTLAFGLSPAVFHFMMREKLPDLPIQQGDVRIDTLDVELRQGHIEISGMGSKATCWCFPDATFHYKVKLGLRLEGGVLKAEVQETDVDVTGAVAGILLVMLGPIIGSIVLVVIEALASEEVASSVGEQADLQQDLSDRLNGDFAAGLVSVAFDEDVEIGPNGVFIHGRATIGAQEP